VGPSACIPSSGSREIAGGLSSGKLSREYSGRAAAPPVPDCTLDSPWRRPQLDVQARAANHVADPPQFECVEVSPVPGTRPSFPITQLSGGRVDGPDVGAGRPSRPFPVPLHRRCPTGNAMGTASTPSRAPRARHQSGGSGPPSPGRPAGQIASARRSRRWHSVSGPREPGSSGVSLRFGIIHVIAERLTTVSRPFVESTRHLDLAGAERHDARGSSTTGPCWSMIKNARPDRHRGVQNWTRVRLSSKSGRCAHLHSAATCRPDPCDVSDDLRRNWERVD
jgi:hypothetical protein